MSTLYKFKVMVGRHSEGGKTYFKGGPDGNTVTTTNDLRKHNKLGAPKFHLVSEIEEDDGTDSEEIEDEVEEDDGTVEYTIDLTTMTVTQLKNLAADEEIDLGSATKKSDIIEAIELARSA